MSVILLNIYNVEEKCYFCGGSLTPGVVAEILVGHEMFVLDESWREEDETYPGKQATEMDYKECYLAHMECFSRLRHT